MICHATTAGTLKNIASRLLLSYFDHPRKEDKETRRPLCDIV